MELGGEQGAGNIQSWDRAKVEGRVVREEAGAAGNIRSWGQEKAKEKDLGDSRG